MKKKPIPTIPWRNRIVAHGEKPASQFLAHDLNARRHPGEQRAAVRGSLDSLGWVAPVIESLHTGKLLDGHARVEEALSKGDETPIPFNTVDLSEEDEKLFLAIFDPIAGMAEYDPEVLAQLLDGLAPTDAALQTLLAELADANVFPHDSGEKAGEGAGGDEFDPAPVEGPTRSHTGDLWLIGGKHRILCADSSDASAVARVCGEEQSINLCVTSPPYFNQRKQYAEWPDYDSYKAFMLSVVNAMLPSVSSPFVLFWNIGDNQEDHLPMIADQTAAIRDIAGLTYIETLIWMKNVDASFQTQRNMHIRGNHIYYPGMRWEAMLVFRLGEDMPHFDPADVEYLSEFQYNIWEIHCVTSQVEKFGHPAVFPLELPSRAIRAYSCKEAVVYDPFMGSGTTLIAAHRAGRICVGIEVLPRFVDVILRRAEAEGLSVELLEAGISAAAESVATAP